MSDGLKLACVVAFIVIVLATSAMVFRARTQSQRIAIARGESSPVLPHEWETGDVQDTTDAQGAHH